MNSIFWSQPSGHQRKFAAWLFPVSHTAWPVPACRYMNGPWLCLHLWWSIWATTRPNECVLSTSSPIRYSKEPWRPSHSKTKSFARFSNSWQTITLSKSKKKTVFSTSSSIINILAQCSQFKLWVFTLITRKASLTSVTCTFLVNPVVLSQSLQHP